MSQQAEATAPPATDAVVRRTAVEPAHQEVRRLHRRPGPGSRHTPRLVLRPARPLGLRQDDDAADGGGTRGPHLGDDHARRSGHHRHQALPAAGQHGLPELRAVPAPGHLRERRLRAASTEVQGRRATGRRDAGPGRARGTAAQEAGSALGWPAAAGRAGPGPDQQARGAPARRAARRARPQAAARDADRAQADPDRGGPHVRARHPRPGGGHDHGRHGRGDEQGHHRADGRAHRALREPAQHVRRQLPGPVQPDRGHGEEPRLRPGHRRHARHRRDRPRRAGTCRRQCRLDRHPAGEGADRGRGYRARRARQHRARWGDLRRQLRRA